MTLTQATVTTLLNRLQERGLVTRRRGEDDRRKVYVELTPEGIRQLDRAPESLHERFLRDSGDVQFISATAVFEDLPAGSYSATIWFWTNAGTSSSVLLDSGGYRGHVVLKESD